MEEWDEWEREMGEDDGAETYTMDSRGRIVASKITEAQLEARLPPPPKKKKRSSGAQQNRLSVPTWFSADSPRSSTTPPPSFVVGRNGDGRYSLQPHAM